MAHGLRLYLGSLAVLACATLLHACSGSVPAPQPLDAPTFAVAKLSGPQGVLEIPVLRAGQRWYADVRLSLAPGGAVNVLSAGHTLTASRPANAVVNFDIHPSELGRTAGPVLLQLPRLHVGRGVAEGVEYELAAGRWRHVGTAGRARTLHSADFDASPHLVATPDDLLVLRSEPGRSHSIPLHLHGQAIRICVNAREGGTDELAILDRTGQVVAATTAAQPCMRVGARVGMHRLRHTYGGNGERRVLFVRPGGGAAAAASPRRAPPRRAAPSEPEYWAIGATFALASDPLNNDTVRFQYLTVASNDFPDCFGPLPPTGLHIGAFVTDQFSGPQFVFWQAMQLFDTYNLFRPVFSANGTLVGLGAYGCGAGGTFGVSGGTTAATLVPSGSAVQLPLTVAHWDGARTFFDLTAGPGGPSLGFPYGFEPNGNNGYAPLQAIPWGVTPVYQVEGYGVQLRYRPNGAGTLAQGQAALFNSNDCTGPAMVVDSWRLNLLPPGQDNLGGSRGPMGDFRGSVLLGPDTKLTIYANTGSPLVTPSGPSAVRNALGCLPNALATPSWTARALQVEGPGGDWSGDAWSCPGCNLANLNLSGHDLTGAQLAGSNLNGADLSNAQLAGADLRNATLQQAKLFRANLQGANLCSAFLNGPGTGADPGSGADLGGAYLRNANLSRANLSGAVFTNASFFSDVPKTCTSNLTDPCAWTGPMQCASAAGATLNNASFASAYMPGIDFGGATGYANFSNAVLVGASFTAAQLQSDANETATNFSSAFLMGATFTAANTTNAVFSGAYSQTAAGCWAYVLPVTSISFPNYLVPQGGYCVPASAASGATAPSSCQHASWSATATTALPAGLGASNMPPAGATNGPCTTLCPSNPFTGQTGTNVCFQSGATPSPPPPPVTPIIITPLPPSGPGGAVS